MCARFRQTGTASEHAIIQDTQSARVGVEPSDPVTLNLTTVLLNALMSLLRVLRANLEPLAAGILATLSMSSERVYCFTAARGEQGLHNKLGGIQECLLAAGEVASIDSDKGAQSKRQDAGKGEKRRLRVRNLLIG
ncbi:hypothetical protein CTAM01_06482 [Colletotrichum tamarilloi]|uniref:Uncharacterized protein n=1 Tax=Colletotrichum tamarilloi TaxID=1209934 RepID=A0ABQ9RBL0_9PEZI|nr:uncharacterized protein CTAM01_06482 [Colletotrichum tamarilloi]KAK1500547.1 hypothetical protein CTAM01_06482 [Colletotrichum tamarilloi]